MAYRTLKDAVVDLEKTGQLVRISEPVDPYLEMAALHRRVYNQQGPALLFENVKESPFQALSNVYGTYNRTEFLFRHSIKQVQKIIRLKIDPVDALKSPLRYLDAPFIALNALPKKKWRRSPVLFKETTIDQLPQIVSWPDDGGAFITLPQVFTLPPGTQNPMKSNLGMYRIQLSGNDYVQNEEIGLHYQLHRGIGVHHQEYNNSSTSFRASIFVGGPPSHAFSAIMPLPEGMSELTFAGLLGGRRFRYTRQNDHFISSDADFCIVGTIIKDAKKPEGPFGDHLGYYSLKHDFPVMHVEAVYHKPNPLWHFTVVGRPPQEDSSFGHLIHQLVGPLTQSEFPGIKAIHAVDAAGVHPLLLAIGSERYMPFRDPKPEEILTQANHILGKGQTSLAKYLWIAAEYETSGLDINDIASFLEYCLARCDFTRDLHFQTKTTIDTLDYSGSGWNAGSKLVLAAHGPVIRTLAGSLPDDLSLPPSFTKASIALKGVLVIETTSSEPGEIDQLTADLPIQLSNGFPLVVVVNDSNFTTATLNNFLWVTFTRSNPSHDVHGVDSFIEHKHWGCRGSLIIDARTKPHHAPGLIEDEGVKEKVNRFFVKNGPLSKWD